MTSHGSTKDFWKITRISCPIRLIYHDRLQTKRRRISPMFAPKLGRSLPPRTLAVSGGSSQSERFFFDKVVCSLKSGRGGWPNTCRNEHTVLFTQRMFPCRFTGLFLGVRMQERAKRSVFKRQSGIPETPSQKAPQMSSSTCRSWNQKAGGALGQLRLPFPGHVHLPGNRFLRPLTSTRVSQVIHPAARSTGGAEAASRGERACLPAAGTDP